jgi:hypothetical protein
MRTTWIGVVTLSLGALSSACATSYRPRPSPRISMVMEDGSPALEKNGNVVKVGPFGGGLVESVEGVPVAEDHADTYRSRMIAGFVIGLLGAPAAGVGTGMLLVNESDSNPSDGLRAASIGLLAGGLALSLTGSILMASAQPHFWDAINVYNDSVPAYGPPPGAWVPGPMVAPPPGPAPGPPPGPAAPPPAPAAPPPAAPPGSPP